MQRHTQQPSPTDGGRPDWWLPVLLLIPAVAYLAITLYWETSQMYVITGDEPHYLLVAESLLRDLDLQVENNYYAVTPVSERMGGAWLGLGHTVNGFPVHGLGLPLLVLPAYALAGPSGARIFLALLASLWPFLLYRAARQVLQTRLEAALLAVTLALGLPFTAASSQVFPDLLAGMLILFLAERIVGILRGLTDPQRATSTSVAMGLALAFLPWLHVRMAAVALVLWAGYSLALRSSAPGAKPWRAWRWWLISSALLLSLAALAVYNVWTTGRAVGFGHGWLGSPQDRWRTLPVIVATNLVGAHWDRLRGMFIQQPLLLWALPGIAALWKHDRKALLLGASTYLAALLPVTAMPEAGGYALVGRYNWPLVALWVFPLAAAARRLAGRRRLLVLLCAAALGLQAWLATKWLWHDGFLYNEGLPLWARPSLYVGQSPMWLLMRLPFFRAFGSVVSRHPASYVATALGIVLIVSGWLCDRSHWRALGALWAAFWLVAAGVLVYAPPELTTWRLRAWELGGQIGALEQDARHAVEADGEGLICHGPYTRLPAGEYQASLRYAAGCIARWSITFDHGADVLAEGCLPPSGGSDGSLVQRFTIDATHARNPTFEFRVYYLGHGDLRVTRLELLPLSLG